MQESIEGRNKKHIDKWEKAYNSLEDNYRLILNNWENNDFSKEDTNLVYKIQENETISKACFKILKELLINNDFFIGGTSNFDIDINEELKDLKDFSSNNYLGKNINYGLRENAIGSIQNGISFVGIKNFSINSLRTVSKLISSMKIASEYNLPNVYVLIEDEDTLIDGIDISYNTEISSLRNIPNLEIYRPCDINELIGVFKLLASKKNNPSCLIINRSTAEIYENSSISDVKKGAYILEKEDNNIDAIIVSSGEEVKVTLEIAKDLKEKGYNIRVVSMPCMELFLNSKDNYKEEILPLDKKTFFIEKTSSFSLHQFVDNYKYLITPDSIKWYSNEDEYISFKEEIIERIENLLK